MRHPRARLPAPRLPELRPRPARRAELQEARLLPPIGELSRSIKRRAKCALGLASMAEAHTGRSGASPRGNERQSRTSKRISRPPRSAASTSTPSSASTVVTAASSNGSASTSPGRPSPRNDP
jgi:hypothetical protein